MVDKKSFQNKYQFNDRALVVWSMVLSQVNGVKPMVVDNLFKAIDSISSGENISDVYTQFEININDDLKFQYVIDTLKPVYESFLSHKSDRDYCFMSSYDEQMMEASYDDDDLRDRIRKEDELIELSYKRCEEEIENCLINNHFIISDMMSPNDKTSFHNGIKQFVEKFFKSQTCALDFYNFCNDIYTYNKEIDNKTPFAKVDKYWGGPKLLETFNTLNEIANSQYVNMIQRYGANFSDVSNEAAEHFADLVKVFASSEGLLENSLLIQEKQVSVPSIEEMIDSFKYKSVYDELLVNNSELSFCANTLNMARALQLKIAQQSAMGEKASPLKVVLEKNENGDLVQKAVFEKGDLLHLSSGAREHMEGIIKDNALLPSSLLRKFPNKRYGDACYGGTHFLEIPINYTNIEDIDRSNYRNWYFKECATSAYNLTGSNIGLIFDGNGLENDEYFDMLHAMNRLQVDARLNEILLMSSRLSSNYYSYVNGAGIEKNRVDYDKCYLSGLTLDRVKAVTLYGTYLKQDLIDRTCELFGDIVPVVVKGEVIRSPSNDKVKMVSRDTIVRDDSLVNNKGIEKTGR